MQDWKPTMNLEADLLACDLSTEDAFLLSRLDGTTPANQLPTLTGLPAEKVNAILERLVAQGAVRPYRPQAAAPAPAPAPAEAPEPAPQQALAEEPPAEDAEDALSREEDAADVKSDGTFRKLYETRLHPLPADQRAAQARLANEPELSAYCFDPLPEVIKSVLENPRAGLAHARLVARHHRNPVGLEAVAARGTFAADVGVRRWLVRNPQLPVGLFRRLWGMRRLLEQHKLSQDRELPEGTRRVARGLLRQRFTTGASEEKVELILKTEGRALAGLVGLPVDQRTASLLCAQSYRSPMMLQNFARWSAAPPALIAHLLKQETVRRSPQLRTLLARHPNAPAHAKNPRE